MTWSDVALEHNVKVHVSNLKSIENIFNQARKRRQEAIDSENDRFETQEHLIRAAAKVEEDA